LVICAASGLGKFGTVAIDGTKRACQDRCVNGS
jgi:hypothetical protein